MVTPWPWVEDARSAEYEGEYSAEAPSKLAFAYVTTNDNRNLCNLREVLARSCRSFLRRNKARWMLHVRHCRCLLSCLMLVLSGALLLPLLFKIASHAASTSSLHRREPSTEEPAGKPDLGEDQDISYSLLDSPGVAKNPAITEKSGAENKNSYREESTDGGKWRQSPAGDAGVQRKGKGTHAEIAARDPDNVREYYQDEPFADLVRLRSEQLENDSRVLDKLRALHGGSEANVDAGDRSDDFSDYLMPPCQGPDIPDVRPNPVYGFVGPFRYLANYKNPCWMEPRPADAPRLRCVPYFYLVGAPKAGTTDLYRRLTRHPEVVMPRSKETRWFDRYRFDGKPNFSFFLKNFQNASSAIYRSLEKGSNFHRLIVGDGSPSYFFDNRHWPLMPGNERCREPRVTVASHIHHLYPKAKVILILRNPVDRLYSSYLYNHAKVGNVSSHAFDQYVRQAISVYRDCFSKHTLRYCANNATVFRQAKVMLVVSLYIAFVRDWLTLFPREQILVLTTEKYHVDMTSQMQRVFRFLDLRSLSDEELSQMVQEEVSNRGQHYAKVGPILNRTRTLLQAFFRPFNEELVSIMNDPDLLWM